MKSRLSVARVEAVRFIQEEMVETGGDGMSLASGSVCQHVWYEETRAVSARVST